MSAVYNLEPQPTAKVLLQTTGGELLLELFAKQTPLTSRNFLQLCLDGYYDNTIFHRLVRGFVLQGGDPTGTGSGGESSFEDGRPFEDEFHSRLKFNRRGLLGMANTGTKDDNGSQFFLTLGDTPELTGKNTMFGRIAGDTIYNLMKMGDGELADEDGDRPLYPYKITGTEILVNPFEDMVKRDLVRRAVAAEVKRDKKKPKRKAGKVLLSFGGDEGEDGDAAPVVKKPKFNPKLVSAGEDIGVTSKSTPKPKAPEGKKEKPAVKPRKTISPSPPPKRDQLLSAMVPKPPIRRASPSSSRSSSASLTPEPPEISKVSDLVSKTNAQIAELKASMRRTGPSVPTAAPKKKSALEAMIPETSTRGRKRRPGASGGTEEQVTLNLFKAFKNKLGQIPAEERLHPANGSAEPIESINGHEEPKSRTEGAGDDDEAVLCDLHFIANCQSCTKWDQSNPNAEDDADDLGSGWMSHKLSFAKDRLGKDLEWKRKNEEELVIIDPREKAKELGVERKKGRDERFMSDAKRGGGGRDWDKGREKRK